MGDRLRAVWESADLDSTEKRLLTLLTLETSAAGRAEVLTQLARIHGLRADFAEADRLLDEARSAAKPGQEPAGRGQTAMARVLLERGRLRRSAGDAHQALPLLEAAFQAALQAGAEFAAVDAAHLAGIVAEDRSGRIEWTRRGMELAQRSADPQLTEWLGPLLTNLGWEYFDSGDFSPALDAFERALQHYERGPDQRAEAEITRYAIARTLRARGQAEEAAPLLERVIAWAESAGNADGWYHEELAETYAAIGRDGDACAQARLALPLLRANDPAFVPGSDRHRRLIDLSGDTKL
jgi:tetratricopeptide (TPR) repeat protein